MKLAAVLILILLALATVTCFDCYKCNSLLEDECYYGYKSVPTMDCGTEGVCIAVKIQVASKEGNYVRTTRGCHKKLTSTPICTPLLGTAKVGNVTLSQGQWCVLCRGQLCNGAAPASIAASGLVAVAFALRKVVA